MIARRASLMIALAAPACFFSTATPPSQPIAQAAPGQPENSDPEPSPPPMTPTPTILAGSQPSAQPVPTPPDPRVTSWSLFKTAGGCATVAKIECAQGAPCSPPPQQAYACPGSVALPATILLLDGDCTIGAPPGRTVPCPSL